MLNENKFSKYLLYALGEIVLVVIGILIALQINTWNEQRKSIAKTEQLLTQIHAELAFNIKATQNVNNYYRSRNKIAYKVLHKEVTFNDYKTDKRYPELLRGIPVPNLKDKAFNKLAQHEGYFTAQQDTLFSKLVDLYEKKKLRVDLSNELSVTRLQKNVLKLVAEKPWYYNYYVRGESTDEMVTYYLNDPVYLNEVTHYARTNIGGHNMVALSFRNDAIECYKELSQYLRVPNDTTLIKDLSNYEHYIGLYSDGLSRVEIKKERSNLIYIRTVITNGTEASRLIIYPENRLQCTIGFNFGQLTMKDDEVTDLTVSLGINRTIYKRL